MYPSDCLTNETPLLIRYSKALQEISELKAALEEATIDTVTHAPLRGAAIHHLKGLDSPVTLAYVDVDNLKQVNDRWGHIAGDQLLMQVVVHLMQAVPGSFVARMGGDEFIVVSVSLTAQDMIARLSEMCGKKANILGHRIAVEYSFGVAHDWWEAALSEADFLEQVAKTRTHKRSRTRR